MPHFTHGMEDLPVEILLHIFARLDLESLLNLGQTSTLFHKILESHKATAVIPILQRDFSPFHELVQVYTASEEDLQAPGPVCLPKRVVFKKHPDDVGVVLADGRGPTRAELDAAHELLKAVKDQAVSAKFPAPSKTPSPVTLAGGDLTRLIRWCRLVKQWEETFPRLRWVEEPENCRFLGPDESKRLRRNLYRWWLYSVRFHGDFDRPRPGQPEPFVNDIRTGQMRTYSTSELYELLDLQVAIEDLIQHYFLPTLLKDHAMVGASHYRDDLGSGADKDIQAHDSLGPYGVHADETWKLIDPNVRHRVVKTYAKLNPRTLMYLFDKLYSYSSKSFVADVRVRHPKFTLDQSTLTTAIMAVLHERFKVGCNRLMRQNNAGGILDPEQDRLDDYLRHSQDGRPNGLTPGRAGFTWPRSHHHPSGDDGSHLADSVK